MEHVTLERISDRELRGLARSWRMFAERWGQLDNRKEQVAAEKRADQYDAEIARRIAAAAPAPAEEG